MQRFFIGVLLVGIAFWLFADVILLFFAAILLAIALTSVSSKIAKHTPLSYHVALVSVILLIIGAAVAVGFLLAPQLAEQFADLESSLTQSTQIFEDTFTELVGEENIERFSPDNISDNGIDLFDLTQRAAATVAVAISYLFISVFAGIFISFEPMLYVNGAIRLFPPAYREKARELARKLYSILSWWLISKSLSMVVIGVLTIIALMIIGMPLAFLLGLIAGLLSFIPTVGPILSAIPAILVAFSVSPWQVVIVILVYLGIQFVESNLVTPIIERKAVSLPPGITLIVELMFGVMFGFLGLLVAAPMFAATIVIIREVYEKDVLGADGEE